MEKTSGILYKLGYLIDINITVLDDTNHVFQIAIVMSHLLQYGRKLYDNLRHIGH